RKDLVERTDGLLRAVLDALDISVQLFERAPAVSAYRCRQCQLSRLLAIEGFDGIPKLGLYRLRDLAPAFMCFEFCKRSQGTLMPLRVLRAIVSRIRREAATVTLNRLVCLDDKFLGCHLEP